MEFKHTFWYYFKDYGFMQIIAGVITGLITWWAMNYTDKKASERWGKEDYLRYKTKLTIEYRQELIKLDSLLCNIDTQLFEKLVSTDFQQKLQTIRSTFNMCSLILMQAEQEHKNLNGLIPIRQQAEHMFNLITSQFSVIKEIDSLNEEIRANKSVFIELQKLLINEVNSNYEIFYKINENKDKELFENFIELYKFIISLNIVEVICSNLCLDSIIWATAPSFKFSLNENYEVFKTRINTTLTQIDGYFESLEFYTQIVNSLVQLKDVNFRLIDSFNRKFKL